MKSVPLLIFSVLSLFGIVSYTILPKTNNQSKPPDPVTAFIVDPSIAVIQFNSTWNKQNEYKWKPINGVRYMEVDIDKCPQYKPKFKLRSLPTVIIYKNRTEVDRFEANVMMKLDLSHQELLSKLK